MDKIELPIRLRPSPWKAVWVLLGSLAFVVAGVFVLGRGPMAGYAAIAFFGFCAVVAVVKLMPGSSYLELSEEGFVTCTLFRRAKLVRWDRIASVGWIKMERRSMVVFALKAEFVRAGVTMKFSRTILQGWDGGLPENYGMTPEKLADLMRFMVSEYGAVGAEAGGGAIS
jgi:hypothetical protein